MVDRSNVLAAFSIDHAARVTGLSKSRLANWDKLGFFSPEHLDVEDRGNAYARVYSFTDLVGLKTLKILRDVYKVPQAELARAAVELEKRSSKPWSEIPLGVLKHKVVFDLDSSPRNVTDGQYALKNIPLGPIADSVAKETEKLKKRDPSKIGETEKNRYIAHNSLVVAGTRIPVATIVEYLEDGHSVASILAEFPLLKREDVRAIRDSKRAAA